MANESITFEQLPQILAELRDSVTLLTQQMNLLLSTNEEQNSETIDIDKVTKLLKKSKSTIYRMTCYNLIPHYKIGNTLHFKEDEIIQWIKSKQSKSVLNTHTMLSAQSNEEIQVDQEELLSLKYGRTRSSSLLMDCMNKHKSKK